MSVDFEAATRLKLRWNVGKGLSSVEDLWDTPLPTLDKTAIQLTEEIGKPISFLKTHKQTNEEKLNELRLAIITYIITVRENEAEIKIKISKNKKEIEKLQKMMDEKLLSNASPDDIQKRIDELKKEM